MCNRFISEVTNDFLQGKSINEIVNKSGISRSYILKIIYLEGLCRSEETTKKIIEMERDTAEIKQSVRKISKTKTLLYSLTKKYGDCVINKLREGTPIYNISLELGVSKFYLYKILKQLKKRGIIKTDSIAKLKGIRLNEKQKEKILIAKNLYDEMHTLEKVAIKLNLTRERVRQLLKLGNNVKLFVHKPYRANQLKELISKIPKESIVKELVLYGSSKNIKTNYDLGNNDINRLLNYYSIDAVYIRKLRRNRIDLKQYQEIVDFLGHHPTTTELAKKSEWRALWYRISRNWGGFDNFRKEYGIPIPQKGYSKFKEKAIPKGIEALRQRGRETRNKYKIEVLELLDKQRGNKLAAHKIAKLISKNGMTVKRCLSELSEENKVEAIKEAKGTYYFLKEPACN